MKKKFTIFVVLLAGIIYIGHAQGVQWIYQQKQEKKNMKNLSEIYFAGGCFCFNNRAVFTAFSQEYSRL